MIQVDPSHFSNVITTVQRTGSLTGGAVRGLPNGVVIEGLKGINSFASDIADAQKEFQLGRVRSSLERVKQIAMQFNGIVSRWNANVGSIVANARQGRQQLSLQKLNELKNAQTKMQQLAGPASKAFQDLVTALEHSLALEGHVSGDSPTESAAEPPPDATETLADSITDSAADASSSAPAAASKEETPDASLLGRFASNYRWGPRLRLKRDADKRARIVPQLEKNRFYFVAGLDPPRVIRVRDLQPKSILVFDTLASSEAMIEANELSGLIKQGIWVLV